MTVATDPADSFPRRYARTQRFTLGQPRAFSISRGGRNVLFLRSKAGDDTVTCLWRLDVETGQEHLLADPRTLLADASDEELTPEERARRERLREGASGIVAYATDNAGELAAFALNSALWITDVRTGETKRPRSATGVIDPRPSPDGRHVAYVSDGALHVVTVGDGDARVLAGPADDETDVTWGLAEFVAAEEMGRFRGYWWSPASDSVLVARVDESPVPVWHLADPANPQQPPRATRYPAAGSTDAHVSLWLVGLDGSRREIEWDHDAFPYLTSVTWPTDELRAYDVGHRAVIEVMSRSQQTARALLVDPGNASTSLLRETRDEAWLDVVPGVPTLGPTGEVLTVEPIDDAYRLCVVGRPVTPASVHVRSVLAVDDATVLMSVSLVDDPTQRRLMEWNSSESGSGDPFAHAFLIDDEPGVHTMTTNASHLAVKQSATWGTPAHVRVSGTLDLGRLPGDPPNTSRTLNVDHPIVSYALHPDVVPAPHLVRSPESDIIGAVFLPSGHVAGSAKLPVLMSPYGGPHAQRVLAARNAHLESQWLADQGFAVVVADGRGTPRSPSWERAVRLDLATTVLDDQVEALHAAAAAHPDLDLTRVGIRGWSFGGYLAALAVLRRPDVFHAAVAGAPVTDWTLYDTFYTERYLGHPDEFPEAYQRSSLIDDAPNLTRSLMLIHGLADDNVVAAHTLRLSSALLAAGRSHTVLPLSGVTHMTPQEVVAENLLRVQLAFLKVALAYPF